MASFTLATSLFPEGTTVGAYPTSNWSTWQLPPSGSPVGSPSGTATVSNGTAVFTGLPDATELYFAGLVRGTWRYTTGLTDNPASSGTFDPAGSAAAAQAASQPLDSDLAAIAALSTTAFGRDLLTQADAAATRTTLGLGSAATSSSSSFDAAGAASAAQTAAIAASLQKSSNLADVASVSTARTNLGLGTAAVAASTDFDASGAASTAQTAAIAASAQRASNLSDLASASTARTNLGLGTAATQASSAFDASGAASTAQTAAIAASAQRASNLSDLASASTARTNLGLGSAATSATTAFDASGAASTAQTAAIAAMGGVYRLLLAGGSRLTASSVSGTKYVAIPSTTDVASGVANPAANSAHAGVFLVYFLAADHALTGLTTKLRLRGMFQAQNTPPGVTVTLGLYPVTIGTSVLNLGTVTTGSTVAFTTPASNTLTTLDSGDFSAPSDGLYSVGYIVSGTPSAGASFHYQLQVRGV